jgi:phosphomevalonate kinase
MSVETIRTSAPGKLFLTGEYAVLAGAPAILTAVDRRVHVTVEESDSCSWRLRAPNLGIENLDLDTDGRLPAGLDPLLHAQLRLFDDVREAVLSRSSVMSRPLAISIDTDAFSRGGHKLGLGSSAAVATALSAALAAAVGLELDRGELFQLAHTAHRRAQNDTGSGGDVAASVYGGLLRYTQGAEPVALHWPAGLSIMAVVTGEGALTTRLVGRVAAYAAEDPESHRVDIARLSDLAARAPAALGHPSGFLRLATDYFTALALLDTHARAGIVSEWHHELHALAKREGGAFKTSGAGGGDVGLAFSYSGEPTQRLAGALAKVGAVVVPLGFFGPGVQEGDES